MTSTNRYLAIDKTPLDLVALNRLAQASEGENGATVIFTGSVRISETEKGLTGMTLDHYPGMTEHQLESILGSAEKRWHLTKLVVSHRVGYLLPGEPIVFVGVCSSHRAEAFEAAQFIMDYLKLNATFWKKEHYGEQSFWVEAKMSDNRAAKRWEESD